MNGSNQNSYQVTDGAVDIWAFSRRVSRSLVAWNIANIAAGLVLSTKGRLLRGVASQNIGWGLINIAIAVIGQRAGSRRMETFDDPYDTAVQIRERRNLTRLLAINAGLDLLYIAGGLQLARRRGVGRRTIGVGLGIMLQGALLYLFDQSMLRDLDKSAAAKPTPKDSVADLGRSHVSAN